MSKVLLSKSDSVKKCQVKTKFAEHTYNFCWSIEDYPEFPATFCAVSPYFHPTKSLSFYARMEAAPSESGYFGNDLDIFFVHESGDDVDVQHTWCVEDIKGKNLTNFVVVSHEYKNGSKFFVLYRGRVFDQVGFILKCKMEFRAASTDIIPKHPMPSPSENFPDLVEDLRNMYSNSVYDDLCLKVKDTGAVFVHKGLLSARSPVFAKMFESPIDEREKYIISIQDIELPVVRGLMEYLYTGALCNEDFDFVCDLYYAAIKYDVSSLRKTCTDVLLAKLNVENACQAFSLANQHSDVQFKDAVMDFIQFHFDNILKSDSWADFLNKETKLVAEVMQIRSQKNKK